MNVYDGNEDFFNLDVRKDRLIFPIKIENRIKKYNNLLPEQVVKDKVVLDLASYLGDAGHWVLSYGAKHYTGVEIQSKFSDISKKLLSPWGNKVNIINTDLEVFLNETNIKFDLIICFGVLYAFDNIIDILKNIFNITNSFILDSITPLPILTGRSPELPMISIGNQNKPSIISQEYKQSFKGFNHFPSISYLNEFSIINGFTQFELNAIGESVDSEILYKGCDEIPRRFYARYDKTHERTMTLQEKIKNNNISDLSSEHYK